MLWTVGTGKDNGHGPPDNDEEWSELGIWLVKNWMIENKADLNIKANNLFSLGTISKGVHGNGDMIQLSLLHTFKNIPGVGSHAAATIKLGNLIDVGFEQWGTIPDNFSAEPRLSNDDAYKYLTRHANHALSDGKTCNPELQILTLANGNAPSKKTLFHQSKSDFGNGYKHSLMWKVCPKFQGQEQEMMEGLVDAKTGKVYSFVDMVDYFQSMGDVYPKPMMVKLLMEFWMECCKLIGKCLSCL